MITPLKVDVFEQLLKDHPSHAFVDLVLRSLQEGFWPWANIPVDYPDLLEHVADTMSNEGRMRFYV